MKIKTLLSAAFVMIAVGTQAQTRTVKLSQTPEQVGNHSFAIYYLNKNTLYNQRGFDVFSFTKPTKDLVINPSGSSAAVLWEKKDKGNIEIVSLTTKDDFWNTFKKISKPVAAAYTADARQFIVADINGNLLFYNTREMKFPLATMPLVVDGKPFVAEKIMVSPNNYFVLVKSGKTLVIVNLENKTVRKAMNFQSEVNDFDFTADNSTLAVATADGKVSTYETRQFSVLQTYNGFGEAKEVCFHPEGKYASVVVSDSEISTFNLLDDSERYSETAEMPGIRNTYYAVTYTGSPTLVYCTNGAVCYKSFTELSPYYAKLLSTELNTRMSEWMKMMPNETMDAYNLRVNDETRAHQRMLFEQEISTRLADNMLSMSEISLGNYNPETQTLGVLLGNMPTIFLPVPLDDVKELSDVSQLQFDNPVYGLTADDKFELIYAEVTNNTTGKTYVFNNLERKSLDYLTNDDSFVPLELIQQANMEEIKLEQIKEDIMEQAKKSNIISDHTHITVNSEVVSDFDAEGKKILNYKVGVSYQVDGEYSAKDDFAPGQYRTDKSNAAMSMLNIVKQAFENDFAQYIREGKKLEVRVTGSADGLPIHGKIAYDGAYGDFVNEPVYKNNELSNITVTKASGITENPQLAFLRAAGVSDYIGKNINAIDKMDVNYKHYIELLEGEGGEFRRISVEFTFIDAF